MGSGVPISLVKVAAMHGAIDAHSGDILERKEVGLRNTKANSISVNGTLPPS